MRSLRKRLTTRLDNLIRDFIRKKYHNRCCKCGKKISGQDSQVSHIVPKGNGASWRRFDLDNVLLMCYSCHINWWHKSPTEAGKWFSKKYPEIDKYLEKYRYGKTAEITTEEMETLLNKLKGNMK
jgi:5-methylcytosine-specific restriction endonuclease McrA